MQNKYIKFRKNLNEKKNRVTLCEKSILVLNDLSYSDIYNSNDGQLLNTFDNNENSKKSSSHILLKNKKTLNLVMSDKRFQIFNFDKMLYDSEIKEDEFYIDYMVNEENDKILFLILSKDTYKIYQLPTLRITVSKPNLINHRSIRCLFRRSLTGHTPSPSRRQAAGSRPRRARASLPLSQAGRSPGISAKSPFGIQSSVPRPSLFLHARGYALLQASESRERLSSAPVLP